MECVTDDLFLQFRSRNPPLHKMYFIRKFYDCREHGTIHNLSVFMERDGIGTKVTLLYDCQKCHYYIMNEEENYTRVTSKNLGRYLNQVSL